MEDLKIDYVLISHTHYDHFDVPTALRIGNRAKWLVPLGVKAILNKLNIHNVQEFNWWDKFVIPKQSETENSTDSKIDSIGTTTENNNNNNRIKKDKVEIVFTPTRHWSSRTIFDRNKTLWGSFALISKHNRFFFGGDTAYCPVFKLIGDMYGPFDIATLPIGAYKPQWFMKEVHCCPAEALQIHRDIQSKKSIAMHWGTFPLTIEGTSEPALELGRVRAKAGISSDQFFTMGFGETIPFSGVSKLDYASHFPDLLASHIKKVKPRNQKFDVFPLDCDKKE